MERQLHGRVRRHVKVDPFGVTSHALDEGRIFALRGELDASTCRELAEQLVGLPGSLIVVDLHELTFIDSSGLGAIHEARRIAIKDGGNLVVCRPRPMVYRVLEITGLDTWVTDWNPEWSNLFASGPAQEDLLPFHAERTNTE
jgi:anti-anti-sigma factor